MNSAACVNKRDDAGTLTGLKDVPDSTCFGIIFSYDYAAARRASAYDRTVQLRVITWELEDDRRAR